MPRWWRVVAAVWTVLLMAFAIFAIVYGWGALISRP